MVLIFPQCRSECSTGPIGQASVLCTSNERFCTPPNDRLCASVQWGADFSLLSGAAFNASICYADIVLSARGTNTTLARPLCLRYKVNIIRLLLALLVPGLGGGGGDGGGDGGGGGLLGGLLPGGDGTLGGLRDRLGGLVGGLGDRLGGLVGGGLIPGNGGEPLFTDFSGGTETESCRMGQMCEGGRTVVFDCSNLVEGVQATDCTDPGVLTNLNGQANNMISTAFPFV